MEKIIKWHMIGVFCDPWHLENGRCWLSSVRLFPQSDAAFALEMATNVSPRNISLLCSGKKLY